MFYKLSQYNRVITSCKSVMMISNVNDVYRFDGMKAGDLLFNFTQLFVYK